MATPKRQQVSKGSQKDPSPRIKFEPSDFDVLDLTLNQSPELRICAGTVKAARAKGVKYPIKAAKELSRLLPVKQLSVEGHILRPALIERYMAKEYFPIASESELVTRAYLALVRCREELAWASRAPAHAAELLKELAQHAGKKGSV